MSQDPVRKKTGSGARSARRSLKSEDQLLEIVLQVDYTTTPAAAATSSLLRQVASSAKTIGGGAKSVKHSRSREDRALEIVPQADCTITPAAMTMFSVLKMASIFPRKARTTGGGATNVRCSPLREERPPEIAPQVGNTITVAVATMFSITWSVQIPCFMMHIWMHLSRSRIWCGEVAGAGSCKGPAASQNK